MAVAVAARNGSQAAFTEELAVAHGDDGFPAETLPIPYSICDKAR
ncbi:MAG TPA: hypothetical protein VFJ27_08460 [Terriglobia bacterium]|nr:hypothetical protein [Terriglobia bacterium]